MSKFQSTLPQKIEKNYPKLETPTFAICKLYPARNAKDLLQVVNFTGLMQVVNKSQQSVCWLHQVAASLWISGTGCIKFLITLILITALWSKSDYVQNTLFWLVNVSTNYVVTVSFNYISIQPALDLVQLIQIVITTCSKMNMIVLCTTIQMEWSEEYLSKWRDRFMRIFVTNLYKCYANIIFVVTLPLIFVCKFNVIVLILTWNKLNAGQRFKSSKCNFQIFSDCTACKKVI